MKPADSLATGQRSLGDPELTYDLEPPLTAGCPETSDESIQYPLEVTYDAKEIDPSLFDAPLAPGLERWQPVLPPLVPETDLREGNTPLVVVPEIADWLGLDRLVDESGTVSESPSGANANPALFVKDESRNPTWSHKDRLNRTVVSAAVRSGATGLVASTSGNHGAAAAAYAARAGLPCVVFTSPGTPPAVQAFLLRYGAAVLAVDDGTVRREAVDRLVTEHDFHPASTRTPVHTGHPWGPEGYTTIAYELYRQLEGTVPGTVVVPTCFAELLYGVWKGFRELAAVGVVEETPRMVAAEPGVRAPLVEALAAGRTVASVEATPTAAYSIKATTSSVRGLRTIRESDGLAVGFTEAQLEAAQHHLAEAGLWQEASGAAGIAGLRALLDPDSEARAVTADGEPIHTPTLEGPIVAIATSSGFKDGETSRAPVVDPTWEGIREALAAHDGVPV